MKTLKKRTTLARPLENPTGNETESWADNPLTTRPRIAVSGSIPAVSDADARQAARQIAELRQRYGVSERDVDLWRHCHSVLLYYYLASEFTRLATERKPTVQ